MPPALGFVTIERLIFGLMIPGIGIVVGLYARSVARRLAALEARQTGIAQDVTNLVRDATRELADLRSKQSTLEANHDLHAKRRKKNVDELWEKYDALQVFVRDRLMTLLERLTGNGAG